MLTRVLLLLTMVLVQLSDRKVMIEEIEHQQRKIMLLEFDQGILANELKKQQAQKGAHKGTRIPLATIEIN